MKISSISRAAKRSRGRAGHSIVEFALAAPTLFLLIFAIVELGRGYMVLHLLNNVARTACRQAVSPTQSASTIPATVNSILASQGISSASTSVTVNGTVVDPITATVNSGDDLGVTVAVAVANVTWIPGASYLFGNLSGQFSLRKE